MPSYLTSRYKIPALRDNYIRRTLLLKKLETIDSYPITCIQAGAGSGKTTLLISYFHEQNIKPLWFTLDEECDDIAIFWCYFIHIHPLLTKDMVLSSILTQNDWHGFIDYIITKLEQDTHVFVIDNIHVLKHHDVLQSLTYFFQHMPTHMHFVLVGRQIPTLALHSLYIQNAVLIIEARDFSLSHEEAMLFLQQTLQCNGSIQDLHALCDQANGWIGGLQLLSIPQSQRFSQGDLNVHLLHDYITHEIFRPLDESLQTFLVKTSILRSFTIADCRAYLENDDSYKLLKQLWDQHFIITILDEEKGIYTYHDILRTYLLERFEQSDPLEKRSNRLRAAAIAYKKEEIQDCLHHLLKIPDYQRAMEVITSTPQDQEVLYYLRKIPLDVICDNPDFAYQYYFYFYGNYEEEACEKIYNNIKKHLHNTETFLAFESSLAIMQGLKAWQYNEILSIDEALKLPLKKETLMFTFLKDAYLLLAQMQYEESIQRLAIAERFYGETHNLYAGMMLYMEYAQIYEVFGHFQEALHAYGKMSVILQKFPLHVPSYEVGLAGIYIKQLKLEEADVLLKRVELRGNGSSHSLFMAAVHTRAQWYCAKQEQQQIAEVLRQLHDTTLYDQDETLASLLKLYYPLNPNDGIFHQMEDVLKKEAYHNLFQADCCLLYAQMLQMNQNYDQALILLRALCCEARSKQSKYILIEADIWMLRILWEMNNRDLRKQNDLFIEALCMATDEEIRLPFQNLQYKMPSYWLSQIETIISKLGSNERTFLASLPLNMKRSKTLTLRECEVLKLISEGKSNKAIAASMVISVSTVKTHILHIYDKLQIKSRVEASQYYKDNI